MTSKSSLVRLSTRAPLASRTEKETVTRLTSTRMDSWARANGLVRAAIVTASRGANLRTIPPRQSVSYKRQAAYLCSRSFLTGQRFNTEGTEIGHSGHGEEWPVRGGIGGLG